MSKPSHSSQPVSPLDEVSLRALEERFCDVARRSKYWGEAPDDPNQDVVIFKNVLDEIIEWRSTWSPPFSRATLFPALDDCTRHHVYHLRNSARPRTQHKRREELGRVRSMLLAILNGTENGRPRSADGLSDGSAGRVSRRIERFFFGNERDNDPGFFDPGFRGFDTPFRYIEIPSFYRRARTFLGEEAGPNDRAAVLAVSGYAPFLGGSRDTFPTIRDELYACAKAGVYVFFVAPVSTYSLAHKSLGKVREWYERDVIDPTARERIRFKLLSSDHTPDPNAADPRFNGEYFSRTWRYAAVITIPQRGAKSIDVIGIQPSRERKNLQGSTPLGHDDRMEFLDWFERVIFTQDDHRRPADCSAGAE